MAPANSTDLMTTTIAGGSGLTNGDKIAISAVCGTVLIGVIGAIIATLTYREIRRRNKRDNQRGLDEDRRRLEEDRRRLEEDQRPPQPEDVPLLTEGTPDQEQIQAVASKAEEAVKKVYTNTGSYVQILPWVDDHQRHITDIYTKLCLVQQVEMSGMIQTKERTMQSYEEMFHFETRNKNPIKRIVVSGSAGMGKTTLIDKIAYDWAMGNSETLNKFKLVFALKMGSLLQSSNLEDAIFEKLISKDSVDKSALKEFIDKNQDKVLILLDGFDECKITTTDTSSFGSILKVLNRKLVPECWVVITSRPPIDKLVNSSLVEKPYTHLRIKGFSDTDIKEYVKQFFLGDHDKARRLIEQIQLSDTLTDLAKSPMLLLLMCLLMGSTENTLPVTMTRLYNKTLNFVFKRQTTDIKDDAISKILISIGEVALGSLLSKDQSFAFREGDFEKTALDAALNAGILTSERVIDGLETYQRVSFIHQTFLEYCAAMYWQSLKHKWRKTKFDKILKIVLSLTGSTPLTFPSHLLSRYEYLFRFCCGDNKACTNCILQNIQQGRDSRLVIICYFESQSKELPPKSVISSILTDDIDISDWNNDSTNAFFHFLNQVAGNDHFSKVKKLFATSFNFQRFGTDLVESIKPMTNLQSLSLQSSSLTAANTNQILSSMATPSTLTELDLSGNEALGGSVSLLAPQLMKLKRLKRLHLLGCLLVAKDVSPIAKSMGDTPVDLDVSLNRALGGCASNWGPELGKMECLQDIHLRDCSLQGTDIEHIAVALSGVSTLVSLDLSNNHALGGSAPLGALKKMNHLKELTLAGCNLTGDDIEPIAESVSELPNLTHLVLSNNEALGRHESSWDLHLKKMKHLKELSLVGCYLTGDDMGPIAESVSDMPNLNHLNLRANGALGGCATLWAQHLKKMNHLRELSLAGCNLEDVDMEPIAESVSDMPNLIHLDLSLNYSLIDCASSSAQHLKLMTKHLKKLILYGLTDEEKEYINTSCDLNPTILDFKSPPWLKRIGRLGSFPTF
ncbi:NLR family CARD domain-containing protein 4-like [Asterias amurensis]|uniref:NLR family CARD domain-containing protein 4-like n=1 Tax=Asterias amurensis TaxID=7602 RepID=UPI003AB4DCB8